MASTTQADTTLYLSLGIDPTKEDVLVLSKKELTRAYKRAALKWHPDKNLDNPSATERFFRIFVAYETLSDPEKRKLYDDKIRAARRNSKRCEQLDVERRIMRENLESRERKGETWADESTDVDKATMERVKAEIERLRREVPTANSGPVGTPKVNIETRNADDCASAGTWAKVTGYSVFRRDSKPNFDSFESNVLAGEYPF